MDTGRFRWRVAAALVAFGLLGAACGDDGGTGDSAQNETGPAASGNPTTTAPSGTDPEIEPTRGGSVTVGMFSETRGLDPATGSGSGVGGGIEMLALFDSLVSWNIETRSYDMRTAESLESNDDSTEWTVKIRPGITFRDGTDYDAEAVKYNLDRYLSAVNRSTARSWLVYVVGDQSNVTVEDSLTVKIKLVVPFAGFPSLLAHSPGMIMSPTILKALGDPSSPDYAAKYEAFNLKPEGAGAGPFEIAQWTKGESIIMKKDPNYWGGDPYLDEVIFVNLNSSDRNVDGLQSGTLDIAFLRTPVSVDNSKADDTLDGVDSFVQAGGLLLMNKGVTVTCTDGAPAPVCVGQPDGPMATTPNTATDKVRQAVAAAIDPEIINQRVNEGKGIPNNALFDENFTAYPGVAGVKPDPARAKQLLEEAKAEGFSGEIRLACTNQPERIALAQAVDTMLSAAGFTTSVKADIDVAAQIGEIITKKDFDLGCWGMSIPNDDTAILSLVQNFWSKSPTNRIGYANAEWDTVLNEALAAKTLDEQKAANKKLAELFNQDVPSIIYETIIERIAWNTKVHGINMTESTMFYLDKAWVE